MKNSDYLMEVSILSTVLFPHHLCSDEEYFNNLELYEEWFQIPFHKIVVRAINHSKASGQPVYEEFIADSLSKRGQLDFSLWAAIIGAHPFAKSGFEMYLKTLMKTRTFLHQGV